MIISNVNADNLHFFESRYSEVLETSPQNQINYFKMLIDLAIKAIDEDIKNYDLSPNVKDAIIDAVCLAEAMLIENDPTLRMPNTYQSFYWLIEWIRPYHIDIYFDDEEDDLLPQNLRRRWLFSFLWTINTCIDDWMLSLAL